LTVGSIKTYKLKRLNMSNSIAIRAAFLDFLADPFYEPVSKSVRYFQDGLLIIENGHIAAFGAYEDLRSRYENYPTQHYPDRLILPGLIDLHLHLPQTEMIASYGEQLLAWLATYTFPTEQKFHDKAYASSVTEVFLDELLRNGTTTALVLPTVHAVSVDAFFEGAAARNLRMICGKVMMDRHAPDYLCDRNAATSFAESQALIEKWHNHQRLRYAVTPRFAPTSTPEQLAYAGKLLQTYPDVYLHTHLSENVNEIAWVNELFPEAKGYLDVYDRFGLVTDRSIFAHCIHLSDREFQRLSEAGSAIAFCPTSNLFLGSGLFNMTKAKSANINVGLATDVGAGTSFSLFQTANAAYKVAQLQQQKLSPFQSLFLATLGGAQALGLDDKIGNFAVGKEADFIVVNFRSTPLMAFRNPEAMPQDLTELADRVFSLVIMGDDRAIQATYIMGQMAQSGRSLESDVELIVL
jgi:guanine deaminase